MFRVFRKLFGRPGAPPPVARRHTITSCADCSAGEGQLHELFCLKERCPFCGGQLATCECLGEVLRLSPEEQRVVDDYIDDSVPPLSTIMARWCAALEQKGRVPFQAQPDTPYHAAYRGDVQAIRDFLDDGLDVNAANEVGYTILMAAARGGNIEILRLLLRHGANARHVDHSGYSALHWSVAQPSLDSAAEPAVMILLLEAGADPNIANRDGITPLMNAAWFGCTAAVRELLQRGADASHQDNQGRTARRMALERGYQQIAEMPGHL